MKIVNVREMQAIEQLAVNQYKVSVQALMEKAGERLASRVLEVLRFPCRSESVVVLAGGGKNGGDGLVCARHLARAGVKVTVLLLVGSSPAPETRHHLVRLKKTSAVIKISEKVFPAAWLTYLQQANLVVDALLGIGLHGPLHPVMAKAIAAINTSGARVMSADIPSGLDADTGLPSEPTVRADWTVTFGLPKRGLFTLAAADFVGRLVVEPLNFPPDLFADHGAAQIYLDEALAASWLPPRAWSVHKHSAGKVLIIGGSAQYHGAPLLAARGAAFTGAGYTALAYPKKLDTIVRAQTLEEIALPLPCAASGALGAAALNPLLKIAAEYDAVVLGPGLGREPQTQTVVRRLLEQIRGPKAVVADADALAALAKWQVPRAAKERPALILTPHAGEAGVLLGKSAVAINRDREGSARELAKRFSAVVLLKGPHSLIASAQGAIWVNASGGPALATAGTGDVLSGSIAAWAAQKVPALEATGLGAYVHGVAGDLAARNERGLGVRAREVAEKLPEAIGTLDENRRVW